MEALDSRLSTLRPRRLVTPILIFLAARIVAPMLAELASSPLMIRHFTPINAPHAYSTNHTIYRVSLAATVFIAVAAVTAVAVRYEHLGQVRWQDHTRQCALLYALGLASGAYSLWERMYGNQWDCWVCPPPLALIVVPAIAANALVLALAGRRHAAA
jgi:hypothetical protein